MTSPTTPSAEMRDIKPKREKPPAMPAPVDTLLLLDFQSDDDQTSIRDKQGERAPSRQSSPKRKTTSSKSLQLNDAMEPRMEIKKFERDYMNLCQDLKDRVREVAELKEKLKLSERVAREQSLELRDLKKQNAQLQEVKRQNTQLQDAHLHRTRSTDNLSAQLLKERDNLVRHLHQQDDVISRLRHDQFSNRNHMESLTMQTREAIENRENLEDVNRKLKKVNRELSDNLTECKDDLLRLQPPSQMSDTEVSEHYSILHQHIARWVDDETEEPQLLEHRFDALPMNKDDLPERLRECLANENLRLAKKHPNAQPLVLRQLIYSFLGAHILREDVELFGLGSDAAEVIRGVEHGMKLLEPKRDAVTIRNWRSETLKAIFQQDEFREVQRSQAILHCQTLYKTLSCLLPDLEADPEGWKSLFDQIFVTALQVSNSIHLSTIDYRILTRLPKPSDKSKTMFRHELQRCEMMDMTSHKMIRPDNILKIGDDGRIGEQMLCVQPALVRMPRDSAGPILLCKPTILVKLDEPMVKRNRGMKVLTSWLGGDYAE